MKVRVSALVIALSGLLTMSAWAQQSSAFISLPYSMSFEASGSDSVELANNLWVFNTGADAVNCQDYWTIGTMTRSEGKRSVYIVHDDTTMLPSHGEQANLQFFYRDFEFTPGKQYTISFDWLNAATTADAAIYVGYFPYTTGTTPNSRSAFWKIAANSTNGVFPSTLSGSNCSAALYNQATWQSYSFPSLVASTNTTYRFYVAWANKGDVPSKGFAGCFDNLQITDSRCKAPTNITTEATACDTLLVKWDGIASMYDVKYRKLGYSQWSTASYSASMGNSCILEALEEGSYEIRIRAIYTDAEGNRMYSAFAKLDKEAIVYCADKHCIDYTNLLADNVLCTTGKGYDGWQANPSIAFETPGVEDYGSTDVRSRHTTNWDRTAYDPRTENKLPLVPAGALASVRLGNWNTGAEAEGITYQYVVDSALSILLLKYACVMEDPDHSANEQPRFTLEILDESGNRIDPTCGFVNFAADATRAGWHTVGEGYSRVTWKDWTTVGLHLDDYVGQTLTVRLATYDCSQSGHYGYAYFVLDCASATIESASCGENTRLEASAPSGFNYLWTDDRGTVVGREQEVSIITTDSAEYTCKLTSTENENCWFELKVLALPRFPIARGGWIYNPHNCENIVDFRDSSYIQTRYHGEVVNHYGQRLVGYEWDFGDGSGDLSAMPNCSHTFPQEGGTFQVTLTAWLAEGEGACLDDTVMTVVIPSIGDRLDVAHDTVCNGTRYVFHGARVLESGKYAYVDTMASGCVYVDSLYLFIAPTNTVNLPDTTICFTDTLYIGGIRYDKRVDDLFTPTFTNRYGCDSVVTVRVHYMDEILPTVNIIQMSETEELATINFAGTGYTYYTINDELEPRTDFSFQTAIPGDYVAHFYNEIGCTDTLQYTIIPPCLKVIDQRWNDVLFVLNEEAQHEIGLKTTYAFSAFQWLRNGEPISGATASYYYVGNKEEDILDPTAVYSCLVTLPDGSVKETCPFTATINPDYILPAPKKVVRNGNFYIENGDAVYNAFGNRVK